ncbi:MULTISPECIES: aspartate/glutamate racemase family protein [Rhizobium]|uniref:Aspartate racemase n=1 Tax=Rhizobium tropici TaxID=398 RepID=A0A6P1C3P1_RHITR|nr:MULTISPECIES: aspartate/glutamate racemase family protein [Rhizobium]AGB73160.1 aspartate/glutamate racemase family protein [Rhizobium tropici CIAT 899]MBB4243668.1 aspartate racemase [Rhizobium tropici]MBB5595883.1 aspartate racemase [Rhizobium tropici]MBB6493875.1 aspartate racemase [Rhizobium tropici]NEV11317.1 aspartate/glutamate racemase family protein [Rhizobium tropici]
MKTIGILGGMSAASTQIYYRELCRLTRENLGGLHSPELLIRSVDFDEIEKLQASSDWNVAANILNEKAIALERGGADLLIMATNTMHKVADTILDGVSIPFIHIADATATAILNSGFRRPGLMATAFTMEQNFYTARLSALGLLPTIPEAGDRAETHRIIYDELCRDVVREESRLTYELIARRLIDRGCDCLILGCTEVGMLLNQDNVGVQVFDTTLVHCKAALRAALQ